MRNYLEILEDIDKLLADNGLEEERQQLDFEIRASSTGGELCSRSGSKLLTLQTTNKQIDFVVGHLIKSLFHIAMQTGFIQNLTMKLEYLDNISDRLTEHKIPTQQKAMNGCT